MGMPIAPAPHRRELRYGEALAAAEHWNSFFQRDAAAIWSEAKDKETFASARDRWRKHAGMTKDQHKQATAKLRDIVKPYGWKCSMHSRKGVVCQISPPRNAYFAVWFVKELELLSCEVVRINRVEIPEKAVAQVTDLLVEWLA